MRKRIYISGPITKPHSTYGRNWNLFQANAAMTELLHDGWAVLNPMNSMANFDEIDWETYLQSDESWLSCAHLILRLPGASLGAERECSYARHKKIPIVGPAYFPCLKELFPGETETTYHKRDLLNLMRFHRECRREQGLPTISEDEAATLHPIIAESFSSIEDWDQSVGQVCQ